MDLEDSLSSFKSDLPINQDTSYNQMVAFFDNRFQKKLEFAADDFSAVVAFFEKRDFGSVSAKVLAQVILSEAKKSEIPVFKILDSLNKYNKIQLTNIILTILNSSRDKTSQLGFRSSSQVEVYEERNLRDLITNEDAYNSLNFTSVTNTKKQVIGLSQGDNIVNLNNG